MDDLPDYGSTVSFLLSQIGADMAQRFADDLTDTGLSQRQFAVLAGIESKGPRTQQQLADSLGMHRNNMTSLVDGLVDDGLARRSANPDDKRAVLVHLTDLGRRRLKLASTIAPDLDRQLRNMLGRADFDTLAQTLTRLAADLELHQGVHPHLAATYLGNRRRSFGKSTTE